MFGFVEELDGGTGDCEVMKGGGLRRRRRGHIPGGRNGIAGIVGLVMQWWRPWISFLIDRLAGPGIGGSSPDAGL